MHRATSKLVMNMVRFLNDDALSVLTCSPGNLILDSIAATRHVKMQVLTEKVLRITGDKEASMAALSDISKKCLAAIKQVLPLLPATYDHAKDTLVGKDVFGRIAAQSELSRPVNICGHDWTSRARRKIIRFRCRTILE